MVNTLQFEPTANYSERPSLDETRTVLYVNVQPRTGGHDAATTLPLDGVILDLNAERSVIGLEILLPVKRSQGRLTATARGAQQSRMVVLNDQLPAGDAQVVLDKHTQRMRVSLFAEAVGEPHCLSEQVTVFATPNRIVAIEIGDVAPELFA